MAHAPATLATVSQHPDQPTPVIAKTAVPVIATIVIAVPTAAVASRQIAAS